MHAFTLIVLAAALLSGCCSSGRSVDFPAELATLEGPHLVVYYPQHATLDTPFMSASIEVNGDRLVGLCEGDFAVIPLEAGSHVVSTSRDDEAGCSKAFLRPKGGWAPLKVELLDEPLFVRYGADDYSGPDSTASICYRHLVLVDESIARQESGRMTWVQ